jgi:tRNA(fMet)-specific endonuclease VapC
MRSRHALAIAGSPIGPNDSLIAAHARVLGCCLVTNNVREFERVPSLTFENWAELTDGPEISDFHA